MKVLLNISSHFLFTPIYVTNVKHNMKVANVNKSAYLLEWKWMMELREKKTERERDTERDLHYKHKICQKYIW